MPSWFERSGEAEAAQGAAEAAAYRWNLYGLMGGNVGKGLSGGQLQAILDDPYFPPVPGLVGGWVMLR